MCSVLCSGSGRWLRPSDRMYYPAGRADGCAVAANRWIWSVIILGLERLNSAQLLLKGALPPSRSLLPHLPSWHIHVSFCLHWIVTLHMLHDKSRHNRPDTCSHPTLHPWFIKTPLLLCSQLVGMPPGGVSFSTQLGLPPFSYFNRCRLSISSNQPHSSTSFLFGTPQSK